MSCLGPIRDITNKIIINPDGNKTVIGKEAHDLYFNFGCNIPEIPNDKRFYVFNSVGDLLAAQNTVELAERYLTSDSVLVCHQ
jgi:hypothetical protein